MPLKYSAELPFNQIPNPIVLYVDEADRIENELFQVSSVTAPDTLNLTKWKVFQAANGMPGPGSQYWIDTGADPNHPSLTDPNLPQNMFWLNATVPELQQILDPAVAFACLIAQAYMQTFGVLSSPLLQLPFQPPFPPPISIAPQSQYVLFPKQLTTEIVDSDEFDFFEAQTNAFPDVILFV